MGSSEGSVAQPTRPRARVLALGLACLLLLGGFAGSRAEVPAAAPCPGHPRTYYIAADEVEWDYAPTGKNQVTGGEFDEKASTYLQGGAGRIGRVYLKALYREYTDGTFARLKPRLPEWEHLGLLGPVLRAEVGDTITVVFRNNASRPYSVHPHGVFYDPDSEGAQYNRAFPGGAAQADGGGGVVQPGQVRAYVWRVPERAGPGPMDPSSVLWMYHSHVDEPADTNAGLVGPLIVTRCGGARPDGSPADVDRELVVMFSILDENLSPYLGRNIQAHAGSASAVKPDDPGFQESNLKHAISGYLYGNLPGLTVRQGERVRWYLLGLGNEADLHTPHWHGNTVVSGMMRMDMVELLPASMKVADMVPDNPGTWLLHCHVNDHIAAGMLALYTVAPAAATPGSSATGAEPNSLRRTVIQTDGVTGAMLSVNVLLMGALAGFTIFLGLPVARMKSANGRVIGFLNSVAIGILVFLLVEVVEHGWEPVEGAFKEAYSGTAPYAPGIASLGIFAGGLLLGLLGLVWFENRYIHAAGPEGKAGAPVGVSTLALMIAVGIGLHNFSEGLAIGASAASGALSFALLLAIGFALHNATEGFGIAAPLSGTKPTWGFLGLAGLIGGGPTFVGTLVGSLYTSPYLTVLFLSLAAGALIYVIQELFHHGRRLREQKHALSTMGGVALGVLLGLGTDLVVTLAGA